MQKAKVGRLFFLGSLMLVFITAMPCRALAVDQKKEDESKIIERIIKIEGTIEKPRVIFIVPRAKLWRKNMHLTKSFDVEMLEPEYPESLIKSQ